MHGSLTAKIYVLRNELKKKENSLESLNNEVKHLKYKIEILGAGIPVGLRYRAGNSER
jgi:hypothetical protein